jgi:hypothetical protein
LLGMAHHFARRELGGFVERPAIPKT